MFSFIRKRLPSKDRNHEHQICQNNDEHVRKSELQGEKKDKSSSTIDKLVVDISVTPKINQPFSNVDYFPMISGGLAGSVDNETLSTSHDSSFDCYINPSESIQVKSHVIKPRVIEIPVTIIRDGSATTNSKRS